ncbi:MAG TPA: redoxin domain-containing protein [Pirellulaceae bacterium]
MRSLARLRTCGLMLALYAALNAQNASAAEPATKPEANSLGRKLESFMLQDFRGKSHSFSDYNDQKAIVLCFLGTECPLAKLYGPRLQKLQEQYSPRGVAFLGISSNSQDSLTELAAYARIHSLTFPILKDLGQKLADQCGATRTPQVFILDRERKIRYAGRIDAQFTFGTGVGLAQPQPARADLETALDELLAGKEISVPVTEVKGCLIGHDRETVASAPVTYSKQIARLIQDRCLDCHREGQIAPLALGDYESVKGWGEMIAEVVRDERMPPWHANPQFGHFANENRLSAEQKDLVRTWVENGSPEGNPADLPPPRKFHDSWFLPREPDLVIYMTDQPVEVKAEGVEPYRHYVVDPGFTEDKWVKLAECMPGNRSVVHHMIVYIKPPGQPTAKAESGDRDPRGFVFLAGFAPGTRPLVSPAGWAKKIPAGSKLVFEMHYTPVGSPQQDRSSIGLLFVDEKEVTHQMATANAPNNRFEIPPHDANYRVDSQRKFDRDVTLLSLFPHMHMRGKSFRYELTLPGSEAKEILLDVPHYDFNWQNSFILAEPRVIPAGSVMNCTAYFDNSDENPANPDPSKSVRWGPQTWEEMMIGWFDIGTPIQAEKQTAEKAKDSQ